MRVIHFILAVLILITLSTSATYGANDDGANNEGLSAGVEKPCVNALKAFNVDELQRTNAVNDNNAGAVAWVQYINLKPLVRLILPAKLVFEVLSGYEYPIHRANLIAMIKKLHDGKNFNYAVTETIKAQVQGATLNSRIRDYLKNKQSRNYFMRLLGDNTLAEVQNIFYGADPLSPSADSLVGQYLAETGASTVVRTFSRKEDGSTVQEGAPRLAVAVSNSTLAVFQKYFSRPEFLFHYHTPDQGTLEFGQGGMRGSYGTARYPITYSVDVLMPFIVLKTTEAGRAKNFFALGEVQNNAAQLPWSLLNYCATGGYNSCTHWVANIPLGDEKVDEYTFPGKVDPHAHNNVGPEPQSKPLEQYHGYENDKFLSTVWSVPGHMPLWQVLNVRNAQVGGYLANPGYVLHVLTGWTDVDRVPVVFVMVNDHKEQLSPDFNLRSSPL